MKKFLVVLLCAVVLPSVVMAGAVTEAAAKEIKTPASYGGGGPGSLYVMAGADFMSFYTNNPKSIFSMGASVALQARMELISPFFVTLGYTMSDIMTTKRYTKIYDITDDSLLDTEADYSDGYTHFVSAGIGAVVFRYPGGSVYLGAGAVYRGGYYTYDNGLLYTFTYYDETSDHVWAKYVQENYSIKRNSLNNLTAYATLGFVISQRYFVEASWGFADMVNNPVNLSIGVKAFFTQAPASSIFYGE
jgi:hypothetical protein